MQDINNIKTLKKSVKLTTGGRSNVSGVRLSQQDIELFLKILSSVPKGTIVPCGNISTDDSGNEFIPYDQCFFASNFRIEEIDIVCDIAIPEQCTIDFTNVKFFPVYAPSRFIDDEGNTQVAVSFKTIGWTYV